MKKFLFLIGVSLVSTPAFAEDLPESDAQITVTANGLGIALSDTGQSVTVIDRAEIDAVQGADVTRVLTRTPGVSFSRNGGAGSVTGVNLRGAASEQLLVLVDGVRVADPASPSGGFDFGNLLTGTVGKIDLLRGSNSIIWGSDAMGGVLNVSTRGEGGLKASAEYGSRDTAFLNGAGGLEREGVFVGLTGSWYRTDGFSAAANGTEDDGFEQYALGGSAFVDLTPQLELFAHGNWSKGTLDLDGYPAPAYALADTLEKQKTRRHWGDAGLAWYGNDLTLRAAYSLSDTERSNRDPDFGETFSSNGHSERVSLRGEYRVIGGLSVAFGGEQEWADYRTLFDAGANVRITGGYLQLGWALGDLAVHAGARLDDHSRFGNHTSLGGDISYTLGDGWRVRASVGEGFKAPTLFQLFSDYGNTLLTPEQSTSYDIGLEHGTRGQGTHFAITAFRRDSEDLVGFISCWGASDGICTDRPWGTYANTGRARAQGVELAAGIDVAAGLRLAGAYAWVDTEDRDTGRELARRPQNTATLFADYAAPFGLKLGADLRLVSGAFEDAGNARRLSGYEVLDLRAAMPVSGTFELFGRIENATGSDYQTALGYNSPGRGFFAGVRARY